jgi:hypothetical protein
MNSASANLVRHFRQILVWPLELTPLPPDCPFRNHWDVLAETRADNPWRELADEFTGDPGQFQERHYVEFVHFLPFVQRFLYGEVGLDGRRSPIHVFRRCDVHALRVTLAAGQTPITFQVAHTDLYFFYDIDAAILAFEFYTDDLPLTLAHDASYRIGRAYPPYWEKDGQGGHCPVLAELLGADGRTLARSDYEQRDAYLRYTCAYTAPRVAAHWEYLISPLAPAHDPGKPGLVRYKQIEDQRMPVMTYLAVDDPHALSRGDFVRFALVTRAGPADRLPYAERFLRDFEYRYCYDRYWEEVAQTDSIHTRYLCSDHAFTMIGSAREPYFTDLDAGLLGHFRHQYFLLGLIAHFHKAALLILSERLSVAVGKLDLRNESSVRSFSRDVRYNLEVFLRFSHRYWFHEISNQPQAHDLFTMWSKHLGNDQLYTDVRNELHDINAYLDSARAKKLADMGVRLGVVATFGFVGVFVTGVFGMNIFSMGEGPVEMRIVILLMVFTLATALTFYTISISKGLGDFLDALSDERLTWGRKLAALWRIWHKR